MHHGMDASAGALRADRGLGDEQSQTPSRHSNECTCFGACCCTPTTMATARADVLPAGVVTELADVGYREAPTADHRRPYSQPFANGPPKAPAL
jgi:hypothetical protein